MITISRTEELMDEHENAAHGAHFEEAKWQSAIDGNADASESKCALNQTHKVRLCVKLPTGQKNTHRARCTTVNITDEAWPIINMSCMVVAANTAESSLCSHIFSTLSANEGIARFWLFICWWWPAEEDLQRLQQCAMNKY